MSSKHQLAIDFPFLETVDAWKTSHVLFYGLAYRAVYLEKSGHQKQGPVEPLEDQSLFLLGQQDSTNKGFWSLLHQRQKNLSRS